jgi:hypothetical protein
MISVFMIFPEKGLRVYLSAKADIFDISKINMKLSYSLKNTDTLVCLIVRGQSSVSALWGTDLSQHLRSRDLGVEVYTILYCVKLMTLRC